MTGRPGPRFDWEVLEAARAVDFEFAEQWILAPYIQAPDINAAATPDFSRQGGAFVAIFVEPQDKPSIPHSYDPRETRRPGLETGSPMLEISPAAMADFQADNGSALIVKNPDLVTRLNGGAVYRVNAAYVTPNGLAKCKLNRIN